MPRLRASDVNRRSICGLPDNSAPIEIAKIRGILGLSPLDDLKTVQVLGELIQKALVAAG